MSLQFVYIYGGLFFFSEKKQLFSIKSKHNQMRQLKINTSITVRNDGLLEKYLNEHRKIVFVGFPC